MLTLQSSTHATMSATLLSHAAASLQSPSGEWGLGPWKQSKVCQLAQVQHAGHATYIQATTSDDMTTWVLCNPSVYGGTGQEDRKGILFGTSPEVIEDLRKVETWAYSQMRDLQPNLDVIWKSVVRDTEIPSFKAKIWVSGKAPCQCVDVNGDPVPTPENWGGLLVAPIFSIGVYRQPDAAGIILEVAGLKILGTRHVKPQLAWW